MILFTGAQFNPLKLEARREPAFILTTFLVVVRLMGAIGPHENTGSHVRNPRAIAFEGFPVSLYFTVVVRPTLLANPGKVQSEEP